MAAAHENIRIIEAEGLVANSRIMGQYLLKKLTELSELPLVGDARGQMAFLRS